MSIEMGDASSELYSVERLVPEEIPVSSAAVSLSGLLLPTSAHRQIGETSGREFGHWFAFEVDGVKITADMSKPNPEASQNQLLIAVDGKYTPEFRRGLADLIFNEVFRQQEADGVSRLDAVTELIGQLVEFRAQD